MEKFIKHVAFDAGKILMQHIDEPYHITIKPGLRQHDLVTDIDNRCEDFIVECLMKEFPEHGILAEEHTKHNLDADYQWILDPLDGTTNYIHKNPLFAISIALMKNSKPILGLVYNPYYNEMFFAETDNGAFLNDKKISVSKVPTLEESVLVTGFACRRQFPGSANIHIFSDLLDIVQGLRRLGSAALDLAYIASGRCDGFWEFNLNAWDVAAGALIVEEAGGHVTSFDSDDAYITKRQILATNGKIHTELLDQINKYKNNFPKF